MLVLAVSVCPNNPLDLQFKHPQLNICGAEITRDISVKEHDLQMSTPALCRHSLLWSP